MAMIATDFIATKPQIRGESRLNLAVGAVVRGDDALPIEAALRDLSRTGCLISIDGAIEVGSILSIGISGIGIVNAHVVRSEGNLRGCEFFTPISLELVGGARDANTVVMFPNQMPASASVFESTMPDQDRWSQRARVSFLMAVCVASWLVPYGILRLL